MTALRRKTKFFCCLALAIPLLLWVSWRPISSMGMEWYLKKEIHKRLGSHLQADKIVWGDKSVLFEHPKLLYGTAGEESPSRFEGELIKVSYDYSVWHRNIEIHVEFQNPIFILDSQTETLLKEFVNGKSKKSKYFHLAWKLSIPRGTLVPKEQDAIFLSLEAESKEVARGQFEFQFGSNSHSEAYFKGAFTSDKAGAYTVDLDFHQTPITQLNRALSFFRNPISRLAVHKGHIDGKGTFYLTKHLPPRFAGELLFSNIQIDYAPFQMSFEAPKGTLSNPPKGANGTKTVGQFTLHDGCHFNFGKTCQASNLTGVATMSAEGEIALNFEGAGAYSNMPCRYSIHGTAATLPSKTLLGWEIAPDNIEILLAEQNTPSTPFPSAATHSFSSTASDRLQISQKEILPERILKGALNERVTELTFTGNISRFVEWLPENFKSTIQKKFSQQILTIQTIAKKNGAVYSFDSTLHLAHKKALHDPYTIKFGFDLRKIHSSSENSPTLDLEKGWFKGKSLPLDLFVEPLIFSDGAFAVTGEADFEGSFDSKTLSTQYQAKTLSLENNYLAIHAAATSDAKESTTEMAATGQHTFRFFEDDHQGNIFIKKGRYVDKKSRLEFSDLNAQIELEKQQIHVKQIEGYCCNLYLSTAIDVDFRNKQPGSFGVTFTPQALSGTVRNAQELFSHFDSSQPLLNLPLEGNLSLSKASHMIAFAFHPEGLETQTRLSGSLTDGTLDYSSEDVSLADLAFDFTFDEKAKTLLLENLQGSAFVGKPEDAEEYNLTGNYIRVSNLLKRQAEFDLAIGNKATEVLRLVGHTRQTPKNSEGEVLSVFFDKDRSHINQSPPIRCELSFDDQLHIDHLHWEFALDLQHLASNLRGISKTKLWDDLGLKRHEKSLAHSKGICYGDVKYSQAKDLFYFGLKGSDLQIDSQNIGKCLLNGKKQGNVWSIDHLQIDNFSAAAEIIKEKQKWIFNFLGLRWSHSMLAGLKGDYHADQGLFTGNVNLLEVDLSALREIGPLNSFIDTYHPQGMLKATGPLQASLNMESRKWSINAQLNTSIQNPELLGMAFKDIQNASCQLVANDKLIIKQLICPFKSTSTSSIVTERQEGFFSIETAEYDFVKNELFLDGAQFAIPVFRLPWTVNVMRQYFPTAIDVTIEEAIKNSKREGDLQGRISLKIAPEEHSFRLELAQGKYWWLDAEHDISHFALEKEPLLVKAVLKYRLEDAPFWIFFQSEGPQFNRGQVLLSDDLASLNGPPALNKSLAVDWTNFPSCGFDILKASGSFAGISADLVKHPQRATSNHTVPLIGAVTLDLTRGLQILPSTIRDYLNRWQINKTYTFTGQWELNKLDQVHQGNFSFQGGLSGHHVELKGYNFEFLQADAFYSLNHIRLDNIILQDPAGFLQIDALEGVRGHGTPWRVSMGNCNITDFQPNLLRSRDNQPFGSNPATAISRLRVSQLQGFLGDPYSFTGAGELYFNNHSRKASNNPLFVIPTEVINRLGLDLSILTPLSGAIFFVIQGGKMVITKLKDVYSEGRLSKFNLANSSTPSYMDFDGNLHLQIRMKHYNILFKLSELFTFNVTGSIQRPVYSINKQPRRGRREK